MNEGGKSLSYEWGLIGKDRFTSPGPPGGLGVNRSLTGLPEIRGTVRQEWLGGR